MTVNQVNKFKWDFFDYTRWQQITIIKLIIDFAISLINVNVIKVIEMLQFIFIWEVLARCLSWWFIKVTCKINFNKFKIPNYQKYR